MTRKPGLSRIYNALVYIFLYAPILVLIIFSFNDSKNRAVWSGFTLHWYADLLHNEAIINAFGVTLAIAVLATLISTVFGTLAAIGFFSMKRRPRTILMSINNIPMTNADIITGVSLMLLFVFSAQALNALVLWIGNHFGLWLPFNFQLGFITLLLAHITFDIPYVLLSVMPCLRQLDKNLSEAAQDLGATPMQAFYKVVLPQLRPGIINGAIIAFTMSVDDFVISYFTAGSYVSNLAMEIYAMARRHTSPEINAISTILFAVVLILLIIINVRSMRQQKAEEKRLHALRKDAAR